MEDLDKFLAFEVKKEIADRYFGFRKVIEEDTKSYQKNIFKSSLDLENKIGVELIRLFSLLHSDDLIHSFLQIAQLPDRLFMDSYLNKDERKKRALFSDLSFRGMTKRSCFKNMFFDTYTHLHNSINEYQKTLQKLSDDQETIREEIKLFYKKNDISNILHFIRSFEGISQTQFGHMNVQNGADSSNLDDKMRLTPPPAVDELLPIIAAIPPLKKIKSELKKLISIAYTRRPEFDIRKR